MDLLPPEVPEPDTFFAIPEIVSWRVPSARPDIAGGYVTRLPVQRFTGGEPAVWRNQAASDWTSTHGQTAETSRPVNPRPHGAFGP